MYGKPSLSKTLRRIGAILLAVTTLLAPVTFSSPIPAIIKSFLCLLY